MFIPYGRQSIDEDDLKAVNNALRGEWITTGPRVREFEDAVAAYVGTKMAVAVNSGTAALHCAMHAAGIGQGDEVILPPMTFVATANAVLYCGGTPVFADVDPTTLLIDPAKVRERISSKTRAIVAVDYAGQPCDYNALRDLARQQGLMLISDACHALGAKYRHERVGALADMTAFSFHPVKHITTGEGGLIATHDHEFAEKMLRFRNHGISMDHHQRGASGTWMYEMIELGHNYRITDFQCALGLSQLKKLPLWLERRREIADCYSRHFTEIPGITPLRTAADVSHAYHLYVIRLDSKLLGVTRDDVFRALRKCGIGVNIHYMPVHLHPYYRQHLGTKPGDLPEAEAAYKQILTLPLHPSMTDSDVLYAVEELEKAVHSN
jgi:perosamine synthetase